MRAIVLAAGEGQRNRPLTAMRPKVMLPVGNKPILEHVLTSVASAGITHATVVVGYQAEAVQAYFQDGTKVGLALDYVTQPKPLGTADALWRALAGRDAGPTLVVPGDTYLGPDVLQRFLRAAGERDALLFTTSTRPEQYGVLEAVDDFVVAIREKPARPQRETISTGIARLSATSARKVKAFVPDAAAGLTRFFQSLASSPGKLAAVPLEGAWYDVDRPEGLLGANALHLADLRAHNDGVVEPGASIVGDVRIGPGARIRSGSYLVGPIVVGAGSEIGPHTVVYGPTSVGDNVTVGPFTELMECVVLADCRVASGCTLHHAVLDRGVVLAPGVSMDRAHAVGGASFGAVVGHGTILGNNVVIQAGSLIGTEARVAPHKSVGNLGDKALVV